jgi:hypothetical protein
VKPDRARRAGWRQSRNPPSGLAKGIADRIFLSCHVAERSVRFAKPVYELSSAAGCPRSTMKSSLARGPP